MEKLWARKCLCRPFQRVETVCVPPFSMAKTSSSRVKTTPKLLCPSLFGGVKLDLSPPPSPKQMTSPLLKMPKQHRMLPQKCQTSCYKCSKPQMLVVSISSNQIPRELLYSRTTSIYGKCRRTALKVDA